MKVKNIKSLFSGFVLFIFTSMAYCGPIIEGKEWRQLTETTGFTWDEVTAYSGPS